MDRLSGAGICCRRLLDVLARYSCGSAARRQRWHLWGKVSKWGRANTPEAYTLRTAPDPISKIRAALDVLDEAKRSKRAGTLINVGPAENMVASVVLQNVPTLLARVDELEAENRQLREQLAICDNSFGE